MTEKIWIPFTEAFNVVGECKYGPAWTGDEIAYDPMQPTAIGLVAEPMERHKAVFKILISMFRDGQVKTRVQVSSNVRKRLRQYVWPDMEKWNWPDEDQPDSDDCDGPPRFERYPEFWFSIPAGVCLFKPDIYDASAEFDRRYYYSELWHQYVYKPEPKQVFVDRVALEVSLTEMEQPPKSPSPSSRRKGGGRSGLTREARSKGGSASNLDTWLQDAIQRIVDMLREDGIPPTSAAVWNWLCECGQEDNRYEFDPVIVGCDFLYVDDDTLHFQNQVGKLLTRKRRSLDRYVTNAKKTLAQNK